MSETDKKHDPSGYYALLGVSYDTPTDEIKKCFRKAALRTHPDKVPEEEREEAHKRFQELNHAYSVVGDPDRRVQYDRLGEKFDAFDQGGGAPNPNQDNFLKFSGGVAVGSVAFIASAILSVIGGAPLGLPLLGVLWFEEAVWAAVLSLVADPWFCVGYGLSPLMLGLTGAGLIVHGATTAAKKTKKAITSMATESHTIATQEAARMLLHWLPGRLCSRSHVWTAPVTWYYRCEDCREWICPVCAYSCHKSHVVGRAVRGVDCGAERCCCGQESGKECGKLVTVEERPLLLAGNEWTELIVTDRTKKTPTSPASGSLALSSSMESLGWDTDDDFVMITPGADEGALTARLRAAQEQNLGEVSLYPSLEPTNTTLELRSTNQTQDVQLYPTTDL